jgi:hypothetical protein
MRHSLELLLTLLALTFSGTQVVNAQGQASVFAIAYIEIKPSSSSQAEKLLRAYAAESRAESGNLRFQVLQRIGRRKLFATVSRRCSTVLTTKEEVHRPWAHRQLAVKVKFMC